MEGKEYICFECGHKSKKCHMRLIKRQYKGYGYDFELQIEAPHCERCMSLLYDREIEEEIRESAHKTIRKQLNELNLVRLDIFKNGFTKGFVDGFEESFLKSFREKFQEGHSKALELSEKLGVISVAKRMKESGYPESEIEKLTELTPEEISNL